MKVPLPILCMKCGRNQEVFVHLDDWQVEATCECGEDLSGSLESSINVGFRLLQRSRFEWQHSDYSLCIVFAAAAFESQLSKLYFKWRKIDSISDPNLITDDELEESLRQFRNIATKINEISKLMHPQGIVAFVRSDSYLSTTIEEGFRRLDITDLACSFQKELFWPRNRILHLGYAKYDAEVAKRCYNTAAIGLAILESLDQKRIAAT